MMKRTYKENVLHLLRVCDSQLDDVHDDLPDDDGSHKEERVPSLG